jgi:hypothetical protein
VLCAILLQNAVPEAVTTANGVVSEVKGTVLMAGTVVLFLKFWSCPVAWEMVLNLTKLLLWLAGLFLKFWGYTYS